MVEHIIRIGTRDSILAIKQSEITIAAFNSLAAKDIENITFQLRPMNTKGDIINDRPLRFLEGKGMFTKCLDEALLNDKIDIAVHSLKDVTRDYSNELTLAAYLPRSDPRDVFISRSGLAWQNMPPGSIIGTCSLRRKVQLKRLMPQAIIVDIRGNIHTRLQKLKEGQVDGIILAAAGIKRANINIPAQIFSIDEMLPAAGQGIIVLQCKKDSKFYSLVRKVNDRKAEICAQGERSLLQELDGDCHSPIGAFAKCTVDNKIELRGMFAQQDGQNPIFGQDIGHDPLLLGQKLGKTLKNLEQNS